ncbi:MAG: DUF4395 domain-containing protein [Ktedonobacteraceae bacterium]
MSTASQSHVLDTPRVDTNQGKFAQGSTVLLTALAFLFNLPILVPIIAIIMAWATLSPRANPYRSLYQRIAVPLGLLKPRIVEDDPAPHRFAQAIGAVFLLASSIVLFFTPALAAGWALDIIVFILAGINLTLGFCAGCFVYYQLGRAGILPRVRYEGSFHWRGV